MFAYFIDFFAGSSKRKTSQWISLKKPVPLCSNYFSHFLCMLTLGSGFKARLQVRQNVFSSKFLWNFVLSSCFFLVFQEAEIHSAGLRPSISMYDSHCLHHQVATAHLPSKSPSRGHGQYFAQPPPQHRPPAAVGPRRRGRFPLRGAATWSLGAPAEVAETEGPVSCMVRWFFRSERMPKRWKNLCWPGHRLGLDMGTLLLHHIHHSCQKMRITSCLLPVKYSSIVYALAQKNLGLQVYQTVTVLKNLPHTPHGLLANYAPCKSIHTKLPDSEGI